MRPESFSLTLLCFSQWHSLPSQSCFEFASCNTPVQELPLFSFKVGKVVHWWTHSTFVDRLRQILALSGFEPSSYSGHSFRRGGATLGFKLGLSIVEIKQRGDWRSSAVESYIDIEGIYKLDIARALIDGASNF